jgi:2,3-bisphosphoglycerate-dependent phosphoglycerate mutase
MKQIYWVRHCQALGQPAEKALTDLGWEQAKGLAGFLENRGIERVVSSPFVRARESVVPLARRLGLAIEIDDRLAERCVGDLGVDWEVDEARALAEFGRTFEDLDLRFPGGESSREAMDRAIGAVGDALWGDVPVVMASHGNLTALMWKYYDRSVGFAHWRALTNPDVLLLTFEGGKPTFERIWEG